MKNKASIYFVLLLLISCGVAKKDTQVSTLEKSTDPVVRRVENNRIISNSLPEIEILVNEVFDYIGKFDFEIIASSDEYDEAILGKPIAAGERLVFLNTETNGKVDKLFIVQFEGFLPQYDLAYNYNFEQAESIGQNKYRHNTWFYDSHQLANENPQNEGAKTRKFIQNKGFELEREYMMSRFVGLASEDRKHEIIIYYIEMLRNTIGYTLEEFEKMDDEDKVNQISNEFVDRSRNSFSIVKG